MNEMDRLLKKYDLDPELFRKRGVAELVNNRENFKIEGEELELPYHKLSAKASAFKSHRGTLDSLAAAGVSKASYPVARFSIAPKKLQNDTSLSKPESISFKGSLKNSVGFERDTFGPSVRQSESGEKKGPTAAVKGITVISRGHLLFPKVTPRFAPHCPPIKYTYEVVSNSYEKDEQREFLVTSLDQHANVVFMDEVEQSKADPIYQGFFNGEYEQGTFLVVLRGEKGEILEVVKMDPAEELDDTKVKYLVGQPNSGAAVIVEEVAGQPDDGDQQSELEQKEGGRLGGKQKSNTVAGLKSRPKNISLMKPRAYTNISNIIGACKRSDAHGQASQPESTPKESTTENERGDPEAGRQTSMSGKVSAQRGQKLSSLAEEEAAPADKKKSSVQTAKSSASGRPTGVTEIYNQMKEEEIQLALLTMEDGRPSEARETGKKTAFGKKPSLSPGRVSQNEKKVSFVQEEAPRESSLSPGGKKSTVAKVSSAGRASENGQPVRVTQLYEEMKMDSLEELQKEDQEAEALAAQKKKTTLGRAQSKVEAKESISPRGSRKVTKQSVSKGSEGGQEEVEAEQPGQDDDPSSPPAVNKGSSLSQKSPSVVGPKISRLSKEGRPTNFSVFYRNFIDNTIDEFGNEIPEEKRSTVKPVSSSILAKRLQEERASRVAETQRQSNASPRPSSNTKKISIAEARVSSKGMPEKIKSVLEAENTRASQKELERVEEEIKQQFDPRMIDEFYRFCRETLPDDARYKESILFVSLFYYFLEVKGLLTEPANK